MLKESCYGQSELGFADCISQQRRVRYGGQLACDGCIAAHIELAYQDPLTGLPNERALEREFERFRDRDDPVGVIFADIKNLKYANDNFGHGVGDKTIQKTAVFLQDGARQGEDLVVARKGGDEFVMLLSLQARHALHLVKPRELSPQERLMAKCKRLRQGYVDYAPIVNHNQKVPRGKRLGLHIGAAVLYPEELPKISLAEAITKAEPTKERLS